MHVVSGERTAKTRHGFFFLARSFIFAEEKTSVSSPLRKESGGGEREVFFFFFYQRDKVAPRKSVDLERGYWREWSRTTFKTPRFFFSSLAHCVNTSKEMGKESVLSVAMTSRGGIFFFMSPGFYHWEYPSFDLDLGLFLLSEGREPYRISEWFHFLSFPPWIIDAWKTFFSLPSCFSLLWKKKSRSERWDGDGFICAEMNIFSRGELFWKFSKPKIP